MGKVRQFTICYDNHPAIYKEGQSVQGEVILELEEQMKIKYISILFNGRAKVKWGRKDEAPYEHRAEEQYFNDSMIVCKAGETQGLVQGDDGQKDVLDIGEHRFRFTYPVPPGSPSSFEGEYGYVRYTALAAITRPGKMNKTTNKFPFGVISTLDLNTKPDLQTMLEGEEQTEVACFGCISGSITAKFRINKQAFVPGEFIYVNAEIHNSSNVQVNGSRLNIKQLTTFFGKTETSTRVKSKDCKETVVTLFKGVVGAGQAYYWENVMIKVPPLSPSGLSGCHIITTSYVIQFVVYVKFGEDIKIAGDITIGTVPYSNTLQPPAYSVVTQQVSPCMDEPPPSYEESTQEYSHMLDRDDVQGFKPHYPVYNNYGSTMLAESRL